MAQFHKNSTSVTGGRSAIFPLPIDLPIAFCTLDSQGYILLISEFAIQMLGYPGEKLIDRRLSDLFCVSEQDLARQIKSWSPGNKNTTEYEMKVIRGDGEVIWVKTILKSVYNSSDELASYFVHLLDITEFKLMERYVQDLSEKSEQSPLPDRPNTEAMYSVLRANQIYEQYLDGLTEAIRSPITNISLRLHMLEHDGSVESFRHVEILREQFHQLKAIVKDLLKFVDVTKNSTHMHTTKHNR